MPRTSKQLASEAYGCFEKALRTDGRTEFWRVKDDSPEWVTELVYAAHANGAMLPDDWRYAFIVEALSAIEDGTEDDLEADIYTGELSGWLASNCNRVAYCDEATEEYGPFPGIIAALQAGQLTEKREVLDQVQAFLADMEEKEEEDYLDRLESEGEAEEAMDADR